MPNKYLPRWFLSTTWTYFKVSNVSSITFLHLFFSNFRKDPHSDEIITLSLPTPPLELGTPPRGYYPLVIILVRVDSEDHVHPDETVMFLFSYFSFAFTK